MPVSRTNSLNNLANNALSLCHTHTHTHMHARTHTQTHTHTLTHLTPSLSHTHTHSVPEAVRTQLEVWGQSKIKRLRKSEFWTVTWRQTKFDFVTQRLMEIVPDRPRNNLQYNTKSLWACRSAVYCQMLNNCRLSIPQQMQPNSYFAPFPLPPSTWLYHSSFSECSRHVCVCVCVCGWGVGGRGRACRCAVGYAKLLQNNIIWPSRLPWLKSNDFLFFFFFSVSFILCFFLF